MVNVVLNWSPLGHPWSDCCVIKSKIRSCGNSQHHYTQVKSSSRTGLFEPPLLSATLLCLQRALWLYSEEILLPFQYSRSFCGRILTPRLNETAFVANYSLWMAAICLSSECLRKMIVFRKSKKLAKLLLSDLWLIVDIFEFFLSRSPCLWPVKWKPFSLDLNGINRTI